MIRYAVKILFTSTIFIIYHFYTECADIDSVWRVIAVIKVSTDVSYRKKIFQHYFEKNPGVRQYRASFDLMVKVDRRGRWIAEKKRNWRTYHPSVSHSLFYS